MGLAGLAVLTVVLLGIALSTGGSSGASASDGTWLATLHAGADLTHANLLHDVRVALGRAG